MAVGFKYACSALQGPLSANGAAALAGSSLATCASMSAGERVSGGLGGGHYARSGQVRFITRPKSRTMRVTGHLASQATSTNHDLSAGLSTEAHQSVRRVAAAPEMVPERVQKAPVSPRFKNR